jgi:UDP-N-acetylmuramoyl-L-alanyl-D-glutamate--2,6-diaminopimelate ligase
MAITTGDLVRSLKHARLQGSSDVPVIGVTHDSRHVEPGFMFASLSGHAADGRSHIAAALKRGATSLLLEPPACSAAAAQILVPSAREALATAAAVTYGAAPDDLPVIGITGTNGKTTAAYLICRLLAAAGRRPALVGSIESRWRQQSHEASHTTPEAPDLHAFWAAARHEGANALVVEASSHGLLLHRADKIAFTVGVFTNLTRDHLDYHPDLDAYRGAKTRLFGLLPRRGRAVISRDDPAWEAFARATRARVVTYGLESEADVRAESVDVQAAGIKLELVTRSRRVTVSSRLFGRFNVANILAAGAVGFALDLPDEAIATGIADLSAVPGRAERIECGQPFLVLNDFAHTPDALAHILSAARELTRGELHVVFGCGGDRDPGKRPEMGRAAAAIADRLTVTSDNPRTEDPQAIIDQITAPLAGSNAFSVAVDRTEAIRSALAAVKAGDTLVVAGKGHERYQIIGTSKHRYDDAEVLRQELRRLGHGT